MDRKIYARYSLSFLPDKNDSPRMEINFTDTKNKPIDYIIPLVKDNVVFTNSCRLLNESGTRYILNQSFNASGIFCFNIQC